MNPDPRWDFRLTTDRQREIAIEAAKAMREAQSWMVNNRGQQGRYTAREDQPRRAEEIIDEFAGDHKMLRIWLCQAAINYARMHGLLKPNMYGEHAWARWKGHAGINKDGEAA